MGFGPDGIITDVEKLRHHQARDFARRDSIFMEFGPLEVAGEGGAAWLAGKVIVALRHRR